MATRWCPSSCLLACSIASGDVSAYVERDSELALRRCGRSVTVHASGYVVWVTVKPVCDHTALLVTWHIESYDKVISTDVNWSSGRDSCRKGWGGLEIVSKSTDGGPDNKSSVSPVWLE